ncbi:hypothetical protein SS1G_10944 [Sclerotinia sclerotiorum 1980 UF-70]|uniref:Dynamin N-terminal domain-containing protein n=1 Tax=Sclerotinia sclerotiorum (strain ATCC 18683 / 1980 / Ss-1) TaxID=665079 RepID=A7F027_SCLS1|nr:hypothetical protein SS1G_10944 [Sclerotinia sclerotiorum 1980 UF-70]EDN95069.1 hypothetical protein SS1G_10944 [Sclerotinia sclerotiorum 1980 UF-70]
MGHESDANASPADTLRQGGIKTEVIDNSASTMSEGRDLSSTEPDTITVTRKEETVGATVAFLNEVENIVASHTDMFPEFKNWQDQAKQILSGVKRPRVLVGVLGYTGSGKSSLINALIDEEMVVPANAMRASTSVVTEISWNDSDDPKKAFRAEIEFISDIEWKMEMDILLGDLKNSTKGEDLSAKSGSEASTASAEISAVWPGVTLAKLKGMTSEELFQQIDGVSDHLDCILDISDSKAKPFSQQINSYIDSNNKQVCAKGMSYRPLVRCVRIYTKAEILRHGLVPVDLPGLGDSNTGRTQVAEKYAENLNYVWIVADIVRAIDDQVAKDLMGKSSRRQLLMDGKYDDKYVTFIMTKTDIINTEEVVESLQLREKDLRNILAREENIINEIHDGQEALGRETFKVKKMRKALKALERSKPSKPGKPILRKRKHTEDDRTEVDEQPLDLRTTDKKISKKKLLVKNKAQAVISMKIMEDKLARLKRTLKLVRNEIKAACTQARNNYTQEHLKMDFENGLQGLLDQLHVFCVSSKGYQKLSGRFKRDRIPEGFVTVNDTFIPSLQDYAAASTLTARTNITDAFLNESNLLKLTIKSWAKNDTPNSLSSSQKHALNTRLGEQIETLNKSFGHAFDTAVMRIREIIETNIFPTLEGCIKASTEKAEQACRNIVDSDTSYQTWKAICRALYRMKRLLFDHIKNSNEEIGDMIMLAVSKDDEAREKVRNTLRNDLKLELNILEAAWVRGASEPTDSLLSVQAKEKPFDESSVDDDNADNTEDTDASNSSDDARSISDDVEDF